MSKISQKDYLKKYLSSDDKLKKKKKKSKDKPSKSTVKIIDDDEYGYNPNDHELDESELFALNEEAPQIVGVIDERAPDVLMKQEYIDSGKWKKIGASEAKSKSDEQKKQKRLADDPSPPRKEKSPMPIDLTDESPPRRRRKSSDESPPRKVNNSKRRDSDASPPRRLRRGSDNSPPRRPNTSLENPQKRRDSDASPPRRSRKSPEKRRESRNSVDNSPPRRTRRMSNTPPRQKRSRWSPDIKREPKSPKRQDVSPPRSSRMTKTLDGKVSGLQDAKTLKIENDAFKERQEKLFQEMRPEMSGRNADIVIRDRRGRNKDFELEVEDERRKAEVEEARKKVYSRWGKGVKQIEDLEKRYQEHMHEASKPLARMADDEDLRDHLRNQERLDDPMLQYMRKKKEEENNKKGLQHKPKYLGQFPDNRFNIGPGYRWDGVDRSNGYEKKFFNVVNSKKSQEEEAYRYSTEDM